MVNRYEGGVLITGGSSGIGRACALAFAKNGATVYAASRSPAPALERFEGGGKIVPVAMDVCSEESVARGVESAVRASGPIGIVIHCAGMGIAGAAEDTPDPAVRRQMDVNFFGVLNVNRAVLPHMRANGRGLVLLIGSVAGIFPIPFQAHYSASKFALEAYARALRMEIAGFGIKVSLIEPGDTKTGFTDARKYELPEASAYETLCRDSVKRMERDERNGKSPDSVAKLAIKLAGRKNPASYKVVGFSYKLLAFLKRLLPDRLVLALLRLMYMG